jgi:hypothetical protein
MYPRSCLFFVTHNYFYLDVANKLTVRSAFELLIFAIDVQCRISFPSNKSYNMILAVVDSECFENVDKIIGVDVVRHMQITGDLKT